jgi:hypothetical protein
MTSLAARLGETQHVSVLMRRLRRLGLRGQPDLIAVAVQRGCGHYDSAAKESSARDPGRTVVNDEELAVAMMLGEHAFDAFSVRCAAQLLSGEGIDLPRLARLARQERCERVLAHVARTGIKHDEVGSEGWRKLLDSLGAAPAAPEGTLPHWTRFVSLTGVQRHGGRALKSVWLRPRR